MNKKIACLLVICLVALSIVYVGGSTALASHATQPIDAVPSTRTTATEGPSQNKGLSYQKPIPLGDPIENPRPHKN